MTIDQTAAFDSISHNILEKKLELYGVGEQARKWIHSYLSFRSNFVTVGGENSHYRAQNRGVTTGICYRAVALFYLHKRHFRSNQRL